MTDAGIYRSRAEALEAENERLRAALAEANRRLGGGCDANDDGPHVVMRDGKYAFCGKCGESLRGVRYCHESRAALRESEAG